MERLDKILSNQTMYSRNDIKKLVSKGLVYVNGVQARKSDEKYDSNTVHIEIDGIPVDVRKTVYLLLNKPQGFVSSTEDGTRTVIDLVPDKYSSRDLFPAGRLDKDTTGLMLITDDGVFAHDILSPKKHVKKEYEVTIDIPMTNDMVEGFKNGIKLSDGECKSAELTITGEYTGIVKLTEGRYHQIKRMFGCYGAKVTVLNRICIGNLYLPNDIKLGEIREATPEELLQIQEKDV